MRVHHHKIITHILSKTLLIHFSFFENKTFKVNQNGTTTESTENLEQQVDQEMKELVQCVYQSCDAISRATKQTFFNVTRSFCYVTHSSPETIDSHISKVIFEDVI